MRTWLLRAPSLPRLCRLLPWLLLLLLGGCRGTGEHSANPPGSTKVNAGSVHGDYQQVACATLWREQAPSALANGLYWLRAMSCAQQLNRGEARAQAHRLAGESWSAALKQSLLIGRAEPSLAERRQILDRLAALDGQFPPSLQPLIQLWRSQQAQILALAEERARYQRLQSSSEAQLEGLQAECQRWQTQLEETQRKLENLTDIERQLSARKQIVPEGRTGGAASPNASGETSKEP
ncbi:two-component system QseEF-associated lipoprotein QseG [Edwardsiella tarda]|uniref:two-component system QseEF-associated lipoprotein QseG n=1 Tax=Edwardsiella tarda TaxID=636 RepID=UPI00031E4DCA|nr:two-component system QseEF-associated lipoprotein QseG [Edwardsiella tarda]WKS80494.1 two-component system QseEF-associated lipoprotein QseG [Edwardsiella tarda]